MVKFTSLFGLFTSALLCTGCGTESHNTQIQNEQATTLAQELDTAKTNDTDTDFEQRVDQYLQDYWRLHPTSALYAGIYTYDDTLAVPDASTRAQQRRLTEQTLAGLDAIDPAQLNQLNKTDRLILINRLQYQLWSEDELQDWRWDPSNYNVAGGFGLILNTNYKPALERLDTVYRRMANIPAYYRAAQENINKPTLPHLDLAIQQNQGAINVFKQQFLDAAEQAGVTQETLELYWVRVDEAVAAIENHVRFLQTLKTELAAQNDFRDFRLGKSLFSEKFRRQIVTAFSADEVYQRALAKKQDLQAEMAEITQQLWPRYFADTAMPDDLLVATGMMINEVAKTHAEPDQFVSAVRQQIADLEAFVREHDLLDLDPSRPLVVREMPEYERGFAVASVDAPGPYAAENNTYYNVTPLSDYDAASAESFLREYNSRTMQILNIHEAVPGHYAQLVHSNNAKSRIKSLFGNGAMVEGWAVYAEHMMMEAGYGNGEPELRLMYDKWLLRTVINAIIDHDIHCDNMSEAAVLDMLQREGFQEQAEATGKWRRATLSQVQLSSYFTGYSEILAFRNQVKQQRGDQFDLKAFHHQFLSYGSAPVPIIKQLMQEE